MERTVLSTLYSHLSHMPADHTAAAIVLGSLSLVLIPFTIGFVACHVADVRAGR